MAESWIFFLFVGCHICGMRECFVAMAVLGLREDESSLLTVNGSFRNSGGSFFLGSRGR